MAAPRPAGPPPPGLPRAPVLAAHRGALGPHARAPDLLPRVAPHSMGAPEVEHILTALAANGHVAASTQNRAFHALLVLYQRVLGTELPRPDALRAKRPKRLPTVLAPEEVRQLSWPTTFPSFRMANRFASLLMKTAFQSGTYSSRLRIGEVATPWGNISRITSGGNPFGRRISLGQLQGEAERCAPGTCDKKTLAVGVAPASPDFTQRDEIEPRPRRRTYRSQPQGRRPGIVGIAWAVSPWVITTSRRSYACRAHPQAYRCGWEPR